MRADHIEIVFQDQYLGRCDMWRLGKQLNHHCVHVGQEINFINSPAGKIQNIYINGKNVNTPLSLLRVSDILIPDASFP